MPTIQENGEDNLAVIMAPTITNIKKMQTMKKTSNPKVAKTTFSTMSGLSQMSSSSFFKMITNPFG
jgi:hypothetical protein